MARPEADRMPNKSAALALAQKILKEQQQRGESPRQLRLGTLARRVAQESASASTPTTADADFQRLLLKQIKKWIRHSELFQYDPEAKQVALAASSSSDSGQKNGDRKKKKKNSPPDALSPTETPNELDSSNKKKKKKAQVLEGTESDRPSSNKRNRDEDPGTNHEEVVKKKKKPKNERNRETASSGPDASSVSTKSSSLEAVASWRRDNKIILLPTTSSSPTALETCLEYRPWVEFDDGRSVLNPQLLDHCTRVKGFVRPSPIQAQAWPILTSSTVADPTSPRRRLDLVGIAETGSGKTLAFGLPALSLLSSSSSAGQNAKTYYQSKNSTSRGSAKRPPRLLVLSPTRELAMQSHEVLQEFGATVGLTSLVVYGGVPKQQQVSVLRQGAADCVVATPGRLKDLCREGSCDLSQIQMLVLDEADRMLDMGFEEDVRFLIQQCPSSAQGRQTAMFSATWPAVIQKMALEYMIDPIRLYVGFASISAPPSDAQLFGPAADWTVDDSLSANKRVKQTIEVIEDRQREARLRALLRQVHGSRKNRVLVFALYKKEAERLESSLLRDGWNCCSIHGNKNQAARTAALSQFKDGSCPLMIATDVAARGLDIPNVEVVINYTFPLTIEDYVHRIGRTGRAGQTGLSFTFFQPTDKSHAGALQQVLRQADQEIPEALLKFGSTIKKKEHKLYGNFGPKAGEPMKAATKITFADSDEE